jgi:hypothetical protein
MITSVWQISHIGATIYCATHNECYVFSLGLGSIRRQSGLPASIE